MRIVAWFVSAFTVISNISRDDAQLMVKYAMGVIKETIINDVVRTKSIKIDKRVKIVTWNVSEQKVMELYLSRPLECQREVMRQ